MPVDLPDDLLFSGIKGKLCFQVIAFPLAVQFPLESCRVLFTIYEKDLMCRVDIGIEPAKQSRPDKTGQEIYCCHSQHWCDIHHEFPPADQCQFQIGCCVCQYHCITMGEHNLYPLLMDHPECGEYFSDQKV